MKYLLTRDTRIKYYNHTPYASSYSYLLNNFDYFMNHSEHIVYFVNWEYLTPHLILLFKKIFLNAEKFSRVEFVFVTFDRGNSSEIYTVNNEYHFLKLLNHFKRITVKLQFEMDEENYKNTSRFINYLPSDVKLKKTKRYNEDSLLYLYGVTIQTPKTIKPRLPIPIIKGEFLLRTLRYYETAKLVCMIEYGIPSEIKGIEEDLKDFFECPLYFHMINKYNITDHIEPEVFKTKLKQFKFSVIQNAVVRNKQNSINKPLDNLKLTGILNDKIHVISFDANYPHIYIPDRVYVEK